MSFTTEFIDSIHQVDAAEWNAIVDPGYPFLQHQYLAALEDTDCTTEVTGWQVHHLLIRENDRLIACMPCYLKHHSYGEYVFDWSWADAYRRAGLRYYPKLLCAIPFTPCTGPRLSMARDADPANIYQLASEALQQQCQQKNLSSAHLLFTPDKENQQLAGLPNWQERYGVQFQWHNRNYQNFDDFLGEMSSRKRKNLRKERQQVVDAGVEIRCFRGHEITEQVWERFYHCYQVTYAKRSGHGGYLSEAFFRQLSKNMPQQVLLVTAWITPSAENKLHRQLAAMDCDENGKIMIASSLFIVGENTLFGRYWGALQDIPGLHFECCYYQGIEFCIKHGLQKIDAGAQGEHKIQRGFEPLITHSWHYLVEPTFAAAVEDFLQQEKQQMKIYLQQTSELSPFKKQG